jgi:hypothetical protein
LSGSVGTIGQRRHALAHTPAPPRPPASGDLSLAPQRAAALLSFFTWNVNRLSIVRSTNSEKKKRRKTRSYHYRGCRRLLVLLHLRKTFKTAKMISEKKKKEKKKTNKAESSR